MLCIVYIHFFFLVGVKHVVSCRFNLNHASKIHILVEVLFLLTYVPRPPPPPRVFSGWNGIQAASGVRDPTRIRESVNRFLQKHQPEFRGEGYLLAFVGELFVGYGRMPIYPFTSSVAPQAYKNSISSHKLGGFSCTCLSVCFAVVGVLIIVLGLYRGADYIWKI